MHKWIICFDLDGTLVFDNKIHLADVKLLANPTDITFVPVTARPLGSIRRLFERNSLYIGHSIPFYMVLLNGSAIYTSGEHLIRQYPIDPDVEKSIFNMTCPFQGVNTLALSVDKIYSFCENDFSKDMTNRFDFIVQPFADHARAGDINKIMCISQEYEALGNILEQLKHFPVVASFSLPGVLEITAEGINKGGGIKSLIDSVGLSDCRICAVGDGENDLPMFDLAEISFAPSTSPEFIQAKADHIIVPSKNGILSPILNYLNFL